MSKRRRVREATFLPAEVTKKGILIPVRVDHELVKIIDATRLELELNTGLEVSRADMLGAMLKKAIRPQIIAASDTAPQAAAPKKSRA